MRKSIFMIFKKKKKEGKGLYLFGLDFEYM